MEFNIAAIQKQIERVKSDLRELEMPLPLEWENIAGGLDGSRQLRSIAKRVVLSAQTLEKLVKENTFQRP